MASGAYHLVLRSLRTVALRAGLHGLRRALRLPVQLLLQQAGQPASKAPTRHAVPAKLGRGPALPRPRQRRLSSSDPSDPRSQSDRTHQRHHPRAQSRAAAPGADRHRHQACAVVQSFDAGLPHAPEPADPDHGAAEMVRAPGRAGPDRLRSRRYLIRPLFPDAVLLRQRNTAPRHLCPAVPAGGPSGHVRRVSRVHKGRRLRHAGILAVRRLERGRNPRNGALRSTGTGSTGNGWSIPWEE